MTSLATALTVLLLVLMGAVACWHSGTLSWARQRQTQTTLESLTQEVEGLDGKMAAALQQLEMLQQEQGVMGSRIATLEAEAGRASASGEGIEALRRDQKALRESVVALGNRLDDLPAIREDLIVIRPELQRVGMASAASQGEPSPGPTSLGVPLYRQTHNLSCEAASASMVAAFFGVSLSEQEIISTLPRHENPNLGFRGDLDGRPGGLEDYGVHAAPIQKLLAARGLQATHLEGGLEGIRSALKAGHPVIAWITYHLWEERPVMLELSGGAKVKVVPHEHTVVIEGYSADGLWALDSYDGERQLLRWMDFERSWGYLDRMAVEVSGR